MMSWRIKAEALEILKQKALQNMVLQSFF